ncbi:toll/interleukin-1 receptor domain-containing protein [Mycolicibacterium nivoides]|uniref:Toll/interleukin-1 receptor domain-containing protein n=1 Tax=Mycolicibacterium nivoides TaxID=2487344 RepID=A0ABW9LDV6_9MYCO|nr:toll/interleukin-1 receptor domain-containing protein [Mycolicibacterium boenickei]SEQ96564.1 TIR domain-containing protein [Mycobacterium sp. 88mf]SFF95226.1 TIR domain-containing protein [Mycobacterium sp. 455mf]
MNDEFWGSLLSHIRHQVLVPVVGPDVTVVKVDGSEQRLTTLVGERLTERYGLTVPPGVTTTDQAVAAFLRERGRDEVDDLYGVIDEIVVDLDPEPGDALRDLAAIDDLRLFVTTTPDRLLAKALSASRGRPVREVSFSPNKSTPDQERNAREPGPADTVVLSLFGQTAAMPEYAIHEEDRLEWIHALLTEKASLPDWLDYPLKHQPMLFIGCQIPDWFGRFLVRLSSDKRLSLGGKPFFFAANSREPSLSSFFSTYCRRTMVKQLDMEPTEFVAQLRSRWEARQPSPRAPSPPGPQDTEPPSLDNAEIFISYKHEDVVAARRLYDAITRLGGVAWLDERELHTGDAWEDEILRCIRQTVSLFVPVISANTERKKESYVFREWNEAVERTRGILGQRFIMPVVIDDDYDGDTNRFKQVPREFKDFQFGHAPGGEPDADLTKDVISAIREIRRNDAA